MGASLNTADFVRRLFAALDEQEIAYCVLHGWEELPERVSSDLDLVLRQSDWPRLPAVFAQLAEAGYGCLQCRHYAGCSYRFDFAWFEDGHLRFVGVDCIAEYRYAGMILATGESLLAERRRWNGFWIAGADAAFSYLLVKKCVKGKISGEQIEELRALAARLRGDRAEAIVSELFGARWGARALQALEGDELGAMLGELRAQLRRRVWARNTPGMMHYWCQEKLRLIARWLRPTGLMVIVVGPDGVGKSALLEGLSRELEPAFRSVSVHHYRARLDCRSGAPVVEPHAREPRGRVASVLRLLLLVAQFAVSYSLLIRPRLGRSGLVLFDRYYHDLLVDCRRYRYGASVRLARGLLRLVPPHDALLLVLDAGESVILSRKQEVSREMLGELRAGYRRLAESTAGAALIRTDGERSESLAMATRAAYEWLRRRTEGRYPEWFHPGLRVTAEPAPAVRSGR